MRLLVGVVWISPVLGSCGGSGGDDHSSSAPPGTGSSAPEEEAEAASPTLGGELLSATEGESSNGYCLAKAQFGGGGLKVMKTIDTLTAQTADGDVEPYLASAVDAAIASTPLSRSGAYPGAYLGATPVIWMDCMEALDEAVHVRTL